MLCPQYFHNILQQILWQVVTCWLTITSGQKNNFSNKFKLKTCNNLPTWICCENVVNVTLLF